MYCEMYVNFTLFSLFNRVFLNIYTFHMGLNSHKSQIDLPTGNIAQWFENIKYLHTF